MGNEATIDTQEIETDNSNGTITQEPPEDGDNSNADLDQEPVDEDGEQAQEDEENTGKFKTIEAATKSYSELQKKFGEQSTELGELRKKAELADKLQEQIEAAELKNANEKGFDTISEYRNRKEIAKNEADEYAKHLNECEFPDEMINLLREYRENPSDELLESIEAEFSTSTLKEVAGKIAILKGQLRAKEQETLEQAIYDSAKDYLDVNVNKYADEFKNPAFAALYGEAFRAYGCDLETDKFVNLMRNYKNSILKAAGIEKGISLENSEATDEIAGLTSNAQVGQGQEKNILEMSEAEIKKELRKYRRN